MKALRMFVAVMLIEKKEIYVSIFCGFLSGVTAVGLFSASGYLISQSALAPPMYTLMVVVALVKLSGMVSALSRYGERFYSHRATFSMLSHIRLFVYDKLAPVATTILQRYQSGDILSRVVGDVASLQNLFLRVVYPPIVMVSVFVATLVLTSIFSFGVTVLIFCGFLLLLFFIPFVFYLIQKRVQLKVRETRGNLSAVFAEFLYGYRELKIHQTVASRRKQVMAILSRYEKEQQQAQSMQLVQESVIVFVSLLVSIAVLAYAGFQVSQGDLEGVLIALLLMVSLTFFEQMTPLALLPYFLQESHQAAERLASVWSAEPADRQHGRERWCVEGPVDIKMENVSFRFEEDVRPALKNVSLCFPAGSKTAIVGASGSGKSTLVQLILKSFPVTSGSVKVNGRNVRDVDEDFLFAQFNVTLQSNHFFVGTLRENLLVVDPHVKDEALRSVLDKVELDHVDLDDMIEEKATNLSGGEKQRLALARMFLKKAPIWLLDEPTSSMDALTEARMLHAVFEYAKSATVVLIGHRLTGLKKLDRIIVVEEGEVIEVGSYEVLMKKKGHFYAMKQMETTTIMP